MSARPRLGLFGGTFDPIHNGHLAVARLAQQTLALDTVRFIPSAQPPHRPDSPRASEYHRLEMVRLAAASLRGSEVSDLELQRRGPSYTFDTLGALHREGLTPLQIFFIIGADAFAHIATWHRYPEILDSAHFAVLTRPGATCADVRRRLPGLAPRMIDAAEVDRATRTQIVLIDVDTPAVSATEVRHRVAAGVSITGLVPPAVAAYIEQHLLYRNADPGELH